MTEPEFRAGECNETSGFLFPHTCGHLSAFECNQCGKPVCHRHVTQELGDKPLCTTCAKAVPPTADQSRDDDPYFYSDHYYTGYYWGHADFNDGDEAILQDGRGPQDVRAFENDMGAS